MDFHFGLQLTGDFKTLQHRPRKADMLQLKVFSWSFVYHAALLKVLLYKGEKKTYQRTFIQTFEASKYKNSSEKSK